MSVWALLQVYLPGAARKRKGFDKGIPNELRSRVMAFELWRAIGTERSKRAVQISSIGEFDPGSGRTLAACLTHASRGSPDLRV